MSTVIFLMNYFWIVILAFFAVAIVLVVRTDKSASTKAMQIAAILIVPLVFAVYSIKALIEYEGGHSTRDFASPLCSVLLDERITDERILAAFADDPKQTYDNLVILYPHEPPPAEQKEDEIAVGELEKSPTPLFWHTFPKSDGPADYSKTPDFSARVSEEKQRISEWCNHDGVVVMGKLRLEGAEDGSGVASRAVISPDGVFVHALQPDERRELQFFKSGYEPLAIWLDPLDPKKRHAKVLDLGIVTMKKAVKTGAAEFRIKLPAGVAAASITLKNDWPAPTREDWSHDGAAPIFKTTAERSAADGETVRFAGLSGIPYILTVTAPGCKKRVFYFKGDKVVNLGEVALSKARKQTFRMRDFSGGEWRNVTLELDGSTSLVVAPNDELGNTVDVELTPDRGSPRVLADFMWRPVHFDDYGAVPPETSPLPAPQTREGRRFLEPGHLYRMRSEMKKVDKLIYLEPVD